MCHCRRAIFRILGMYNFGVGQENKSPRPHFDPNKLPSKDGGRSENFGGVTTNVLGVILPSLIETWLKVHFCQKILIFLS